MIPKQRNGTMASNPSTGECIGAIIGTPRPAQSDVLMATGSLFERRPLDEIKEAFCRINPSRQITLLGPSIGKYMGDDIPEWQQMADGTRYEYIGVSGARPNFDTLVPGQFVLAPGLIYQRRL